MKYSNNWSVLLAKVGARTRVAKKEKASEEARRN